MWPICTFVTVSFQMIEDGHNTDELPRKLISNNTNIHMQG